jgi:hypothetical protein
LHNASPRAAPFKPLYRTRPAGPPRLACALTVGRIRYSTRVSSPPLTGKPDPDLNRIVGKLDSDFVRWADSRFLDFIVEDWKTVKGLGLRAERQ